jgi:hypothetical protein
MQARSYIVIVLVLVVLASAGAGVFSQRVDAPAAAHGDFATRFQPAPVQVSKLEENRQRQAGIGSIKELRPVEIPRKQ